MGYPNVIYGDYGDEKVTSSAKIGTLPMGQLMVLPDGRKFRHSQAGSGADLGAGVLVASSASVAGHGGISGSGLLASTATAYNAVSATTIHLLAKSAAVTEDQYADGLLNVIGPAASTYIGRVYKIKSNKSAASASDLEIELESGDGLEVAFAAGSTTCGLRRSQYKNGIIAAPGLALTGTTPTAVTKSYYYWAQRSGPASLENGATACVVGEAVAAASAEAGSVSLGVAVSIAEAPMIGMAMDAGAASEATLVNLTLE